MTAANVNANRLKTFKKKRANINTACPPVHMSLYSNRIIKLFSLSALFFFVIRLLLCFRWRRLYALSAGEGVEGKGMIETYKIVSGKYDSLAAPMLPSPHMLHEDMTSD